MQSPKLHIGCGKNYLPGWTNLDLFSVERADIYADITALPFPRESFDLIYASHVLEHCHRRAILSTLGHWRDLLRTDGILRLAVPDFSAIAARYTGIGNLSELIGLLFGGQTHPKNNHFITFDADSLSRDLRSVGFNTIRRWDWRSTEHAQYDDYSQCYLPHMDKENGRLMSLNIEAVK